MRKGCGSNYSTSSEHNEAEKERDSRLRSLAAAGLASRFTSSHFDRFGEQICESG